MSDIVNLRRRRKAKARESAALTASQNRLTFGLSKAARQKQASEKAAALRFVDGHKRDNPAGTDTVKKTDG